MTDPKKTEQPNVTEETTVSEEKTPAVLDTGDAVDPFERLQKKQVAVAPGSSREEVQQQVQSVVKK